MDVTCPEEIHFFMSSLNTKPKPGMCCDLMFGPFGLTLLGLKMLFHFRSVAIGSGVLKTPASLGSLLFKPILLNENQQFTLTYHERLSSGDWYRSNACCPPPSNLKRHPAPGVGACDS